MSTVLLGYARTPFVRFSGVFAGLSAVELGAHAVTAALARSGVSADQVDRLIAGQVLQAGAGQNPARQTAVAAGIPMTTPAVTINAVCLAGTESISDAHRLIATGEAQVVVVVGQESMTNAPRILEGSRSGAKYGPITLQDVADLDGLTDAFEHRSMGASTDSFNPGLGITRAEQDEWALLSNQRAAAATEAGILAREIEPVEVPRKGTISADDGIRTDTTIESLAALRPAFSPEGTITAGSASQISDGAAAVVVASSEWAAAHGLTAIATILATSLVAGPDISLHSQPANAIDAALARTPNSAADLAAVEINEAFAAVAVQSVRELGIDPAIVNRHGGAIALGHPIGASGTRIVGHLALTLADLGSGSIGAAGICGGGGQGAGIVLVAA